MHLILKGKTHKAKNRIREHGNTWHVIRRAPHPVSGKDSFFVQSIKDDPNSYHRWIDLTRDQDFDIIGFEVAGTLGSIEGFLE